MKFTEQ